MTEQDTREKLEKDVRQYANPSGYKNTLGARWEQKMLEFLDRQAAITEREQINKCIADQIGSIWMRDDIRKLKAERDELKAERDELKAERDELKAERDELKAERDELKEQIDDYKASMETLEANANLWREQADKLKAENKRLSDRINGLLLELLIIAEKLGAENVGNKKA